jgi:two-component system, NtrC family, sensor histidine kinase KinB
VTFRSRLLLAQAPLVAALLLVGAVSLRTVSSLGQSAESALKDNYRSAVAAQRMSAALERMNRDAVLRAVGWTPTEPQDAERVRFDAELRSQWENITEPGEEAATHRLRAAWDAYREADERALSAPDRKAAYLGPLQEARLAVQAATDEILSLNADAMEHKSRDGKRTARRLLQLMIGATGAALALGLVASTSLTARIVKPLLALTDAVRRFGEGHVDARVRSHGTDEIASLAREFDTMADRLERYRRSSLGELMRAQQSAQAAIESLHHPVLILDAARTILNLNRTAESVLGLRPEEARGKPLQSLPIDTTLRERLEAACAQVVSGRGPYVPHRLDEAVSIARADGPRRFLPQAAALTSQEGSAIGVTIVLQDVTRLARFDELRNDLVATVAHEFRTPLTSLQMAVHMCADGEAGPLTDEQAMLLAGARKDCERLQDIVEEILDLSRIQTGNVEVDARTVEADRLVEHAVATALPSARAAGVEIVMERAGQLPVLADPERVDIVLANLLLNAVRHSPASKPVVARVTCTGETARFEVRDCGPGIPLQYVDRVFERFFRVPGAKRGGIGLGLYIAREIVRAHGGMIGVDSEPGQGSTFWFTLQSPARLPPDADPFVPERLASGRPAPSGEHGGFFRKQISDERPCGRHHATNLMSGQPARKFTADGGSVNRSNPDERSRPVLRGRAAAWLEHEQPVHVEPR